MDLDWPLVPYCSGMGWDAVGTLRTKRLSSEIAEQVYGAGVPNFLNILSFE